MPVVGNGGWGDGVGGAICSASASVLSGGECGWGYMILLWISSDVVAQSKGKTKQSKAKVMVTVTIAVTVARGNGNIVLPTD